MVVLKKMSMKNIDFHDGTITMVDQFGVEEIKELTVGDMEMLECVILTALETFDE